MVCRRRSSTRRAAPSSFRKSVRRAISVLDPNCVEYPWITKPHAHLATAGFATADVLAAQWDADFSAHLATLPNLSWKPNTRVLPNSVNAVRGGVSVDLEDVVSGSVTSGVRFDYVFLAVGFGTDGARVNTLMPGVTQPTPAFWDNDSIASLTPPAKILISGGGDGALQDFLRAVVNPAYQTAEQILAGIEAGMRSNANDCDVERAWSLVREAVAYAETQAGRAVTWLGGTHSDIWNELAGHYRWTISEYLAPHADELFQGISVVANRPAGPTEVILAFPDQEPGKVYALNRFLFMLLAEFAAYLTEHKRRFFGHRPAIPSSLSFPKVSILRRHRTDLAATVYDQFAGLYNVVLLDRFSSSLVISDVNELLVRHGTKKPPPLAVRVGRLPPAETRVGSLYCAR